MRKALSLAARGIKGAMSVGAIALLLVTLSLLTFASPLRAAVTVESFSAEAASTAAGAHTDVTTSFAFQTLNSPGGGSGGPLPNGGDPRDIALTLPRGLVGNLNNLPRCPRALFDVGGATNEPAGAGCPANTQVGLATLHLNVHLAPEVNTIGIFNVEPGPDEPALLGIEGSIHHEQAKAAIHLAASAGANYALTATTLDVQQKPVEAHLLGATITIWGVPGTHERASSGSNWGSNGAEPPLLTGLIPAEPASLVKPLIENPTDCSHAPLTTLSVNTVEEPDAFTTDTAASPIPTDCADVPFAPAITATPDTWQAGAPTGMAFDVSVPQSNDPSGRGTSELEQAVVTLPAGTTISPSAASALLEGCTDEQFGAGSDAPAQCPAASQIGIDEVESPLLPPPSTGEEGKLTGKVFLGQPLSTDPTSGQMYRVFQELKGFGLDIKLEGSVKADPTTGQLKATFANLPELPFQNFKLHFKGGPNAVLANPTTCGMHTITTQLYPYSAPNGPATPSSTFTTSDAGGPCPAWLPFSVQSSVSTASDQAGASSPLTVSFSRADETQPLGRLEATLPTGLLGYVSKVPLCEAAAAVAGTCGPESRIGTVSTSAGAGPDPLTVPGSVFLARGSNGYPFMLSVVVPAVAGPYNLGSVTVPVWLQVNSDGSITALSGPLPSILDGIPLGIRLVTMTLDRPGFTINPTSCIALNLNGIATSLSGATAALSAPFSVLGCGDLTFEPSFTVATQGSTSKQNGASLVIRVAQNAGEANIHSVHVELPKSLPSRLSTLNKACTEQQFAANPAGCPRGSVVGTAVANTPLLTVPITGPAILVSHAGSAFPDLDIVLQGDGITIDLVGNTDIKRGITNSTFASVPDVPISGFELKLPEGPYSIFAPDGNLCEQKLLMPTTIIGQNGTTITQSTRIAVTGCPKPVISVVKTKAKPSSLLITLKATAAGTVKLSGVGLDTKIRKDVTAGKTTVKVGLTRAGLASLHSQHKLKIRLKASFTPSRGSGSSVSTTLTFR
jgi:hypothetical protein